MLNLASFGYGDLLALVLELTPAESWFALDYLVTISPLSHSRSDLALRDLSYLSQ